MPRVSSGSVTFAPGGRLTLEVDGGETEVVGRAGASEVTFHADDGLVQLTGRDGAVHLEGRRVRRLRVDLPSRAVLRLEGRTSFRVSGIQGAVTVDVATGAVRLEDIGGDVRVDTGMGAVEARRIAGSLHVDTGAGPVVVEDVRGDVHVDTGAGRVRGEGFGGGVRVDAGAGSVELAGLGSGTVHVDTGVDGVSLSFDRSPRAAVRVDAPMGAVKIELPPGSAADLDLRGETAHVELEGFLAEERSPDRVRGRLNGGGPSIRAEGGHGVRVSARATPAVPTGEWTAATGDAPPDELELQVLRMLAEGRISLPDAEELLDALGGDLRDEPEDHRERGEAHG